MAQKTTQKELSALLLAESSMSRTTNSLKTLREKRIHELEADYLQNLKDLKEVVDQAYSQFTKLNRTRQSKKTTG